MVFTGVAFLVHALVGLTFLFLAIVVLIVIIITSKKTSSSSIPSPEKTSPKGYRANQLKETNSPRYEHATSSVGKGKKIFLIILIIVGGFFGILIGSVIAWQQLYPEELAQLRAETAEREAREKQIELQKQAAEKAQKEKASQTVTTSRLPAGGLPVSCDGVVTTESYLYPTADQCIKDLTQGFSVWCLSEERKLSEQGAEDRAKLCMRDIALRLVELCEEPVIGSQELCLMNSMQHLYKGMIQK